MHNQQHSLGICNPFKSSHTHIYSEDSISVICNNNNDDDNNDNVNDNHNNNNSFVFCCFIFNFAIFLVLFVYSREDCVPMYV